MPAIIQNDSEVRTAHPGPKSNARFLMCRPQYFDVGYVINPWMKENVHRVKLDVARAQWTALYDLIRSRAGVDLIDAKPEVPDMVFTANAGLVVGPRAVLSNFRFAQRKPEEPYFEAWFENQGLEVFKLPEAITFEGAGDALLDRHRGCIWMGYGHRSDRRAAAHLEKILGFETIALELTDPRFYHLDTCFCPMPDGHVLFYPQAFSPASRALLKSRIGPDKEIPAAEEDAVRFACNAVEIDGTVLLNGAGPALTAALARAGFHVEQCCLSEFLRSGGAAKCLTLRMESAISS